MRSMKYLALWAGLLTLVLTGGMARIVHQEMSLRPALEAELLFEIPRGAHLNSVIQRLSQAGLLATKPLVFQVYARATGYRGAIQAGEYKLVPGMDGYALLHRFRTGEVHHYKITFPEGWSLAEWRAALEASTELQHLAPPLSDTALAASLGIQGAPEGWFYPDTYAFVKGDRDLAILQRAHVKMKQVLEATWDEASREAAWSMEALADPYAALILASMIEKETGHAPDRAIIASVFHNRLRRGMRLQSDPTVIYGLAASYAGNLTRRHLNTDSPYNTYTRSGLPPTPICAPGPAAIKAAFFPASSDYLYFVAKGNGQSYFSSSLDEHILAVRRYQQQTRKRN